MSKPGISFDNTEIAFAHKSDKELKKSYRLFRLINNRSLTNAGIKLTSFALRLHLPVKPIIKHTIFDHFCGGEYLSEAIGIIRPMGSLNVQTILDYGVEGKSEEATFEATAGQLMKTMEFASKNENIPIVSCKPSGLAPCEVLQKIQAGEELNNAEQEAFHRWEQRMEKLCAHAAKTGIGLYVDAEESWIQDPVDELMERLMARYNKEKVSVFTTAQMYRHDRLQYIRDAFGRAKVGNYYFGIKLVRGAYMEKERERAREMGYLSPIHKDKYAVDEDYDAAVKFCVENIDRISVCSATHNEVSNYRLADLILDKGIDKQHPHIMFCQLYGMSDHITFNLACEGYNASKYVPYGPVKDVVPYLIRRAEENTAMKGQMGRELALLKKEILRRGI